MQAIGISQTYDIKRMEAVKRNARLDDLRNVGAKANRAQSLTAKAIAWLSEDV